MTHNSTGVLAFDVADNGKSWVYEIDPGEDLSDRNELIRSGLVVGSQSPAQLLTGRWDRGLAFHDRRHIIIFGRDGANERTLLSLEKQSWETSFVKISPNARYVLALEDTYSFPRSWLKYADEEFQVARNEPIQAVSAQRYLVIDTNTGTSRPLFDAPAGDSPWAPVVWSADDSYLILTAVYLPLNGNENLGELVAKGPHNVAAVFINDGSVEPIRVGRITDNFYIQDWDSKDQSFTVARWDARNDRHHYVKSPKGWMEVNSEKASLLPTKILVDDVEDINHPPDLRAIMGQTNVEKKLTNLNPLFQNLEFGRVEEITWKTRDGHTWNGGLVYPVDYQKGTRYPLVIQTHGFNRDSFLVEGPYKGQNSAFAAQPLAAHGFCVLQIGYMQEETDWKRAMFSEGEIKYYMGAVEGAIDNLSGTGLVDRNRVGYIGFSRTGMYLAYILTHSSHRLAAATMADSSSGGYEEYITSDDIKDRAWIEQVNGGKPWGDGLRTWQKTAPGFRLAEVNTPLRIEMDSGLDGILDQWEMFAGLRILQKPVEMVIFPGGTHILMKPSQRFASEAGNVDWFRFWLKNEEDPDPAKADQYGRWRKLRKQQESSETQSGKPQTTDH